MSSKIVHALVAGVIGGAVTLFLATIVRWPRLQLSTFDLFLLAAGLVVVLFLLVALHEAGHLVAGMAVKLQPCLYIAGPLKLERLETGWRAGLNRVFPLSGGLAACIPRGTESLRERTIALVAGGPAASFVVGGMALALILWLDGPRRLSSIESVRFLWVFALAAGSFGIGFVALVPGQGHGFSSDGARLLALMRKGPAIDAEVALMTIVSASIAGQRPSAWDSALVQRMLGLPAGSPAGVSARLLAHVHELDCGRIGEARRHLDEAMAHRDVLPVMSRPTLLLLAARFAARTDHDPVAARRLLTEVKGEPLMAPHSRPLIEAAVRNAEGRRDVVELLDEAERALPQTLDRGGAVMAAELIARLRKEAFS